MKNWKIPAVILPLLFFGWILACDIIYQSMDTNSFDSLVILWFMIILANFVWLLFVFPWKRIKVKLKKNNNRLIGNWKIPTIILVLLIIAMTFRWSTISSQTTSKAVLKHVQDNWSGTVYEQSYPIKGGYNEKIVRHQTLISFNSQDLTVIWGLSLTGSIIWLLIAVSKTKKEDIE